MGMSADYLKKKIKNVLVQSGIIDPFRKLFNEIEFETTSYCNRKCEYCPNSLYDRKGDKDGRFMCEEVFTKLLEDLEKICFKGLIAPHLYGEPLTDPRLADWILKIRKSLPECRIKVVTNGDFLDKSKYDMLIHAGVDYFFVSKHGEKLSQNMIDLLSAMKEDERLKRITIFDYYADYRNEQKLLNTRGGDINLNINKIHPVNCGYAAYPVVNTFGDVILCCNDFHGRYKSGNIMERSLPDIWKDPENVKLRKRIYKGHFDLPICQNCWK